MQRFHALILALFILACSIVALLTYRPAVYDSLEAVSDSFDKWRSVQVERWIGDRQWCAENHPGLYDELYQTQKYFSDQGTGPLTDQDYKQADENCRSQGSCVQLKIWKGHLYIGHISENEHCFQSRMESIVLHIYTSLQDNNEDIPDLDFWINCSDPPRDGLPAFWQMSKPRSSADSTTRDVMNYFLMPDFNFYAWPEISLEPWALTFRNVPRYADAVAGRKIHKMLWRGASWTSPSRGALIDLIESLPHNGTDIADVQNVDWGKMATVPEEMAKYKTSAQRCDYRYIIYTEGITYSGRMKYALLCDSIMLGPRHNFIEFWTHLLYNESTPAYVVVRDDWSDLVETFHKLEKNKARANTLAHNARQVAFKYLSPQALKCYTRELIRVYAGVCTWTVTDPDEDRQNFKPIENYLLPRLRGEQPPGVW